MKTKKKKETLGDRIHKGVQLAFKRLVEETKRENGYLWFSQNGKIVKVKAEDL